MNKEKKPMGCLKMLMYIVLWSLALLFIIGYLATKYDESENEKLSSMTENEKKEYYQQIEKRNAASEKRKADAKLANEKREAADALDYCQTAAHALIRKSIKNSLKDPSSFREISHKYYTNAIELSYTATNGFGGRVQEAYRYHFEPDVCGKNTSAEKIR